MANKLVEIKNLKTYFFVEATDKAIDAGDLSHDENLNELYKKEKKLKGKVPAKYWVL